MAKRTVGTPALTRPGSDKLGVSEGEPAGRPKSVGLALKCSLKPGRWNPRWTVVKSRLEKVLLRSCVINHI